MARVRISITVDGDRLQKVRKLLNKPDSELVDRALGVLLNQLQTRQEIEALRAMPYEEDPDLAWEAPSGSPLPYDGDTPQRCAN